MGPYTVVRTGHNRYSLRNRSGRSVATRRSRYLARAVAAGMWYNDSTAARKRGKTDGNCHRV